MDSRPPKSHDHFWRHRRYICRPADTICPKYLGHTWVPLYKKPTVEMGNSPGQFVPLCLGCTARTLLQHDLLDHSNHCVTTTIGLTPYSHKAINLCSIELFAFNKRLGQSM